MKRKYEIEWKKGKTAKENKKLPSECGLVTAHWVKNDR